MNPTVDNWPLQPGSTVAIVGGGPAGSLAALQLSSLTAGGDRIGRVLIFERRGHHLQPWRASCNLCAGVLAHTLVQRLAEMGIDLSEESSPVQRRVKGYCVDNSAGRLLLDHPARRIYTAYRSTTTVQDQETPWLGFDAFLLNRALDDPRTELVEESVTRLVPGGRERPAEVWCEDSVDPYSADVVLGAFGVNSELPLTLSREQGYRLPVLLHARQLEIELEWFSERLDRGRVHILYHAALTGLRFVAVTPKRDYATVTILGTEPNRELPDHIFAAGVGLLKEKGYLCKEWTRKDRRCRCFPTLPVSPSPVPFMDRIVLIGDASGYTR